MDTKLVTNPDNILVGHNIKFDIKFLENHFKIKHQAKLYDTNVMHGLIDENSTDNDLKALAATYTNLGHYGDDLNKTALENEKFEDVIKYNQLDSITPLKLFEVFYPILQEQGLVKIFEFISEMMSIFVEIEQTGVYINTNKLRVLYEKNLAIQQRIKNKYITVSLTSGPQVAKVMHEILGIPIIEVTKTGKPSTAKDILNALLSRNLTPQQDIFIRDLLDFRKADKFCTDHLPRIINNLHNNRFHSEYNLAKGYAEDGQMRGTVTGRLSSSPNIQNIPTITEFREIFEVSPDYQYFVTADYSQIELRVAAFLSREPNFIKAFEAGLDVHTSVMCDITKTNYEEINAIVKDDSAKEHRKWYDYRLAVKRVNFGIMYGIQAKHLVKLILQMGVKLTAEECGNIIKNWYAQNLTLMNWIRTVEDSIIINGMYRTIFGRIRHLVGANRKTDAGSRVLRQGINFPIQSAASDICLLGIKNLHSRFKDFNKLAVDNANGLDTYSTRLLMTVHDEISFETKILNIDTIKDITRKCMLSNVKTDMLNRFRINFDIPLDVDIHIEKCWTK